MSTAPLLHDEEEQPGSESPPLLTPRSSHSFFCNSTDSSGVCATCSHRRQRSRLVWAVFAVWAVPLALAGGRWCGLLGSGHHGLEKDPHGSLLLAQVGRDSSPAASRALRHGRRVCCMCCMAAQRLVPCRCLHQQPQVIFRHGARTPLSSLYWPNSTWSNCSQHPLAAPAASSSGSSGSIRLQLYDPSGAPNPPELSGVCTVSKQPRLSCCNERRVQYASARGPTHCGCALTLPRLPPV